MRREFREQADYQAERTLRVRFAVSRGRSVVGLSRMIVYHWHLPDSFGSCSTVRGNSELYLLGNTGQVLVLAF